MSPENPYAEQTAANAGTPWLGDGPPVDVDLDGLREYARRLADQQSDIAARAAYLGTLSEMPGAAWNGDVLGEADAVRAQLLANAAELTIYLVKLGESLRNVGTAARSIADKYRSGDAFAAASLADVDAAFAPAVARAGATAPAGDSPLWRDGPVTPISAQQTAQTSTGPDGERREVTTVTAPGGAVTVTTTVLDRSGEVVSTGSTRTTTRLDGDVRTTTEETFGPDGTLTATTTTTTEPQQVYGQSPATETSRETVDATGRTTSLTTETVDAATGERTTSTFRPDDSGLLEETDRVRVGARTPGGNG